jgi:mannose-6-phosphate isomerase-like protein (cupin superfamily)
VRQSKVVAAHVVDERSIPASRLPDDTAETRLVFSGASGSERLEQRVIRFGPGRSKPQPLEGVQGILYVVSGSGTVEVGGETHGLEAESGAYFVPGESFEIENEGPEALVTVLVTTPPANGPIPTPAPRVVHYRDRESLPAGKDREFRLLVHRDTGCPDVTQFIGVIPPGRAPMHSHVYDEVIYLLEGHGKLHIAGEEHPIAPGSCMHLPPLVEHCLENESGSPMRVLGVFHPSGDPASRAYEANE